jgi:hypothetical protein
MRRRKKKKKKRKRERRRGKRVGSAFSDVPLMIYQDHPAGRKQHTAPRIGYVLSGCLD